MPILCQRSKRCSFRDRPRNPASCHYKVSAKSKDLVPRAPGLGSQIGLTGRKSPSLAGLALVHPTLPRAYHIHTPDSYKVAPCPRRNLCGELAEPLTVGQNRVFSNPLKQVNPYAVFSTVMRYPCALLQTIVFLQLIFKKILESPYPCARDR